MRALTHPCTSMMLVLLFVAATMISPSANNNHYHHLVSASCYNNPDDEGWEPPASYIEATDPAYGFCKPGWYCPFLDPTNSSTNPKFCPPSVECMETRIKGDFCEPQGPFEPTPCPYGSYCPTATQKLVCPEGYFCPIGSTSPRKCSPFAYCPEGTRNEYDMVGILLVVLVDILVVVIILVYRRSYRQQVEADDKKRSEDALKKPSSDSGASDEEMAEASNNQLAGSVKPNSRFSSKRFFELVKKARGASAALLFQFNKLSVKIPKAEIAEQARAGTDNSAEIEDKQLLAGVTGSFAPGTVTAVMGPSGAGKTVLLSTVLDKISTSWIKDGELTVNGKLTVDQVRHVVGFVPQDDVLHTELTVEQNLYFSSETRLPNDFTPEERAEVLDGVLRALQLEHVRHVQIGDSDSRGVSGGQRKRCSIGMEMAACPTALFLDEPTTGLDAATALELCTLLKRLSRGTQTTVAMVVHQPRVEIWEALDQVLLLAPGGRTVYQGPQSDAQDYFANALGLNFESGNPADTILDGIAAQGDVAVEMWQSHLQAKQSNAAPAANNQQEEVKESAEAYSEPQDKKEDDGADEQQLVVPPAEIPPVRGASFGRQFILAFQRMALKINTSLHVVAIDILLSLVCCVVMGAAKIREEWIGVVDGAYALVAPKHKVYTLPMICMFFLLAVASSVAPAGVRTFGRNMPQYWREASNGHNKLAYFLGSSLVDLLRCIVTSVHFCLVGYLMTEPFQNFWTFYLFTFLLFICCDSQSAMLSMWLRPDTAPLLSTVIAVFMSLLNGFPGIPVVGPISYAWWATQGWMGEQVDQVENIFSRKIMEEQAGEPVMWNLSNRGLDIGMLLIIYTLYRTVGFILMVVLNREKQR